VLAAAGLSFDQVARVGIYMTDLGNFAAVNDVMKQYFSEPYPARSTIGVAALPKASQVEIDLVAVVD
jgi:reactive intermediate/imine deaminase